MLENAIVRMFAEESDIVRALPFESITGNALKYNREGALPGVGFRGINEAYTESTGVLNPVTESLAILGGDIDVDKFLVDTMGAQQRDVQRRMKVAAMAQAWARTLIKGDTTSQPREFDGLQVRLGGAQLIANSAAAGGGALSLARLDEAIDAVDNPTHLIMAKAMRRRFTALMRNQALAGNVLLDKDEFGRPMLSYGGLPILVGYSRNGGVEPIPFVEVGAGGGAAQNTSIYVVSFGPGRLTGIRNGGMQVRDLGELQSAPVLRDRVETYAGIALMHGRAAARLSSVNDAAITA